MIRSESLAGLLLFLTALSTPVQVSKVSLSSAQDSLAEPKIASGLKEALRVGTDNAVKLIGRPDGYYSNEAIKILLPKNLRPLEKALRAVGYGPQVDAFILSMNRAAESAAPQAKKIFIDAILSMSFDDARKILSGGDTAATDYFKSKTTGQLTAAFRPIVEKTMDQNKVAEQYKAVLGQTQSIPFVKAQNLDITDYVVSEALNGLFYMVGQEERKIRKNPAAQTTSLLKQVFGR